MSEMIILLDDVNYLYELIDLKKLEIRDYCESVYDSIKEYMNG